MDAPLVDLAIGGAAISAGLLGFLLGSSRSSSDDGDGEPDRQALRDERDAAILQQDQNAAARFQEALNACQGPRWRLARISQTASKRASTLRAGHAAGHVHNPKFNVDADWQPPWELRRGSARLPVLAWQSLDRAFDTLLAAFDDPGSDLLARAAAFDVLAAAAQHVADALGSDRHFSSALAICTFCGKRSSDVKTLIAGELALICDECVDVCVGILEERLGEDWRAPSD